MQEMWLWRALQNTYTARHKTRATGQRAVSSRRTQVSRRLNRCSSYGVSLDDVQGGRVSLDSSRLLWPVSGHAAGSTGFGASMAYMVCDLR